MDKPEGRSFIRRVLRGVATPRGIVLLFVAGTILRLILAIWGGFQGDLDIFKAWSQRLVDLGLANFYDPAYFADYPPGYLYVLWFLGKISSFFGSESPSNYLLKLPAVLSDVGLAYVAMQIAARTTPRSWGNRDAVRAGVAAAVLFNPAFLFVSAIWGQVDSLTAFLVLGGFLLLATGRRSLLREAGGVAVLTLAFGSKPQAVFLLPVAALLLVWRYLGSRDKPPLREGLLRLGGLAAVGAILLILLGIPFGLSPLGLIRFYQGASGTYPYTSVWAFNLWALGGFWQADVGADAVKIFGIPAFYAGLAVVAVGTIVILARLWRALQRGEHETRVVLLAGAAVSLLTFAVSTRMHERYLFLGIACLAPFVVARSVRRAYYVLSMLYLVNLYFPYAFYVQEYENQQSFKIDPLFNVLYGTEFDSIQRKVLGLLTGAACLFAAWAIARWLGDRSFALLRTRAESRAARSELSLRFGFHAVGRRGALLGLIVFLVVLPTRLVGLSSPPGMQFDEVYHGRAAGEYLAGKEIFEFTHPPLAKELMAISLRTFSSPRVTHGATAPAGISEGLVATDGRSVAWASSSEGGSLTSGVFDDDCSIAPVGEPVPLGLEPTSIVQTSDGVFVGGAEGTGGAVAWVVSGDLQWEAKIPAAPVSVGIVGQTGFTLDDRGTLLSVRSDGAHSVVARDVGAIASDRSSDKIWASQPEQDRVLAFDSAGEETANVTLAGEPGAMVLAQEIPRLVIAGADAPRLEGVNSNESEWSGQTDGLEVGAFGHVPEADVVWGIDGRRVQLIEALGLTEIGTAELPEEPVAVVGDLERNLLVTVGSENLICVAQDHAFGWRFPAAILGAAMAALAFLLALRCFGKVLTAALAALFVTFDGLLFVMSRVAMIDAYLVAFIVASWLCAVSAMHHWGRRGDDAVHRSAAPFLWLLGCGIFAGAAIASKWTGVYSLFGILLLFAWDALKRRDQGVLGLYGSRPFSIAAVAGCVLIVPAAVYLLTYIPYFSLGHGLGDWASMQANMYDYHAHLKAGHPYSSFWYEWPLARGAVFFYASADGAQRSEIWTIGNPVVFLGGLVGLLVLTVSAWRRKDVALGAVPWAVFTLMAPWILVSRELFLYHYAPVVPFLAIGLAWLISARTSRQERSWIEMATVAGAVIFVFCAAFPLLDGWYVPQPYIDQVKSWMPWVF